MNRLWVFVQAYLDDKDRSAAWLAHKIGTSSSTLNTWKIRGSRPEPDNLRKLADAINVDYEALLAAVEADDDYRTDDEMMAVLRDRNLSAETVERLRRHVSAPIEQERDRRREIQ